MSEDIFRCSFCTTPQKDTKKLIAGPNVYICAECVDICNGILVSGGVPMDERKLVAKSASRWVKEAEAHRNEAVTLSGEGHAFAAAQELRDAAVAALRGLELLDGRDASVWRETKVILEALSTYPKVQTLLQVEDRAHVLLRVSIHGAQFSDDDLGSATTVATNLIEFLRGEIAATDAPAPTP